MTSFLAERRSPAVHRVGLLAVGALVATGLITGLDRTTAAFGDDDGVSTAVTTRPACVPDPKDPSAYASGMLDADNPLLRWTFTDGLLPEATILPTDPNAPVPKVAGVGLLVCDPAELAGVGARGSLSLTQAGADSGLTATTPVLGSSFTLLFWTSADRGAAGELASLRSGSGDLVLSLSETQRVQLTHPTSDTPVSSGSLADGVAHLVAVTFAEGIVSLTVDGASAAGGATTWAPSPDAGTLTIGARTKSTSAGVLIDEVTLLSSAYGPDQLKALVEADRWWAPGPLAERVT